MVRAFVTRAKRTFTLDRTTRWFLAFTAFLVALSLTLALLQITFDEADDAAQFGRLEEDLEEANRELNRAREDRNRLESDFRNQTADNNEILQGIVGFLLADTDAEEMQWIAYVDSLVPDTPPPQERE
jgi:septal ring factor EnvC (AmiA/AmiB activator)